MSTPTTSGAPTLERVESGRITRAGTAATRLAPEFEGVFGTETIDRFLHSSFEQFALRDTVVKFLPLMAERFARQRLRALAKVEGLHDDGNWPCRARNISCRNCSGSPRCPAVDRFASAKPVPLDGSSPPVELTPSTEPRHAAAGCASWPQNRQWPSDNLSATMMRPINTLSSMVRVRAAPVSLALRTAA